MEAALAKAAEDRLEQERLDREAKAREALASADTKRETVIAPNVRTSGSEEEVETERERAARYARQNLELHKEGDRKAGWKLKNKDNRKKFEEVYTEPVAKTTRPERKTGLISPFSSF